MSQQQPPSIAPSGRARRAADPGMNPGLADRVEEYTALFDAAMKRVVDAQDEGKHPVHCGYEYNLSELVVQVAGFQAQVPIPAAPGQKAFAIASFRIGTPGVPANLHEAIEEDDAGLVQWLDTHMDEMVPGTCSARLYVLFVHVGEDGATVFARLEDESGIDLISVLANPLGLTACEAWALVGTPWCVEFAVPDEVEISVGTTPYVAMA